MIFVHSPAGKALEERIGDISDKFVRLFWNNRDNATRLFWLLALTFSRGSLATRLLVLRGMCRVTSSRPLMPFALKNVLRSRLRC